MKIIELYDKTINDVGEVIAEYLTVSESTFLRWHSQQIRIRFEQNLKKYGGMGITEKRFKPDTFDSDVEMLELLNTQAEIISDLEEENNQLKQKVTELENRNIQLNTDYKATHETIWEQKQQPTNCLKCKYLQKVKNHYEVGFPVTTTYICSKNKYKDKMSNSNYHCDTYEEKEEKEV